MKHIVTGNKVIALRTYKGKTYRGVAICHESDTFDLDVGIRVADAKCMTKVAGRRLNDALDRKAVLLAQKAEIELALTKLDEVVDSASKELSEATLDWWKCCQ